MLQEAIAQLTDTAAATDVIGGVSAIEDVRGNALLVVLGLCEPNVPEEAFDIPAEVHLFFLGVQMKIIAMCLKNPQLCCQMLEHFGPYF